MNDFKTYLILFIIIGVSRVVLPKVKKVKTVLINRTVLLMEKRIKGSKRGPERKEKACKRLRWLGVKIDEATSNLIDLAVEAMNAKNEAVKSNLQAAAGEAMGAAVDSAAAELAGKPADDNMEVK